MAPGDTACGLLSAVTTAQGWAQGTLRPLGSPPGPRAAGRRKTGCPLGEVLSRPHGRNTGATCRSFCPTVTAPGGGEEVEARPGSGEAGAGWQEGQSGRLAARDRARGAQGGGHRTADSNADTQPGRRDGEGPGGVGHFWNLLMVPRTGDRCGPSLQTAKLRLREMGDQRPAGASLAGPPSAGAGVYPPTGADPSQTGREAASADRPPGETCPVSTLGGHHAQRGGSTGSEDCACWSSVLPPQRAAGEAPTPGGRDTASHGPQHSRADPAFRGRQGPRPAPGPAFLSPARWWRPRPPHPLRGVETASEETGPLRVIPRTPGGLRGMPPSLGVERKERQGT